MSISQLVFLYVECLCMLFYFIVLIGVFLYVCTAQWSATDVLLCFINK